MWPIAIYAAMVFALLGNWLLAQKNILGWYSLFVGSVLYILYFTFSVPDIHMVIITAGYLVLEVYGIYKWRRNED